VLPHVIRRCRQVAKLGPGSVQNWTNDVRSALAQAHEAVQAAKADGQPALDAELLAGLRARYDRAVAFGQTHNRHRDCLALRSAQMRQLRLGRHHDDGGPVGVQRGGELLGEFFGVVHVDRPAAETLCDGGDVEAG
jgi:hypothetical protein